MSRSKRKTGTRQGTIIARRNRQAKAVRLSAYFRRFGIFTALLLLALWAGAWLIVSGAAERSGAALTESFYQITADRGFLVRDVLVEGRRNADPDVLLGLLNVDRGDPIFAFHPDKARAALQKESWIEKVRVERRLPGLVYVAIQERTPFALWQYQGVLRLIDPQGVVITDVPKDMARFPDLPLVVGDGAPKAAFALFDLMKAEPVLIERVEAATYIGERRWDLKLKNNVAVRLPEEDLALALRRLAEAQETDKLLDKEIESVDLREDGRIVVRTRPGAVQDYKASFKTGSAI
jgi:cell division protein FtsQ